MASFGDVVGRARVIVESDVDQSSVAATGGKIGDGLKKGALVGVAALGSLVAAGTKAVLAFEDAESVSRKLGNVLGNMGVGSAADEVEALASSLSKVTGIDDEVIKGGQTVLATFSSVAESAGEAGGTFERATIAAADLAATGFGDVSSASTMLGKALQDPIKGITALSRAGVTFTEAQKEQIKGFVETNDLASAQALILAEVERQVGGTAEAGAKASERLKTGFGEVQQALGGLIADLFDVEGEKSLMDLAADATFKLAEAIEDFQNSKSWKDAKKDIKSFAADMADLARATKTVITAIDGFLKTVSLDEDKGLLWWLNEIDQRVNPIRRVADAIKAIGSAIDSLGGGSSDKLISNKDLTNLLLGGPLPGRASGGPASGWTIVGEEGPEIVKFPSGSHVFSNEQSQGMGDVTINQTFNGPTSGAEARNEIDWSLKYGTRFPAIVSAV